MAEHECLDAPAPAKLNLFLHVTGRRPDGYHLLESVFQLVDLQDRLDVGVRGDGRIHRTLDVAGVAEDDDLAIRAARALQRESGATLGADIQVRKTIPMGGGLGGGSSDAATTLLVLNRLWRLDWPLERLMRLGAALGADVPFFLFGRTAFARGIGEVLEPVEVAPRSFVVVAPPVAVPTRDVFSAPELTRNTEPIKILGSRDERIWSFRNDLEPVVTGRYPAVSAALSALKDAARAAGLDPTLARMTGSGACVFCPVPDRLLAEHLAGEVRRCEPGVVHVCEGLSRHPLGSRQVG
jgi:4-diphosphocytidyl-2-C-methyl-D-erythritol kinase